MYNNLKEYKDRFFQTVIKRFSKKSFINKDENIHKSETLKRQDKPTFSFVECQNFKFICLKLLQRILFKDILTFIGLVFRDASLILLYLVVIGIRNYRKVSPLKRGLFTLSGICQSMSFYRKWCVHLESHLKGNY